MDRVTLKIKRLDNNPDLELPYYQSDGSSGLDLCAAVDNDLLLQPGDIELIPTGISVSIPQGFELQVRPRSGLALRHGIGIVNSPGTIDSDYRGEIKIILINWGKKDYTIKRGDRIAQIILSKVAKAAIEEVSELGETSRGEGGFGHSGI